MSHLEKTWKVEAQSRYLSYLLRVTDSNECQVKDSKLLNIHCNFNNYYLTQVSHRQTCPGKDKRVQERK